MKSKITVDKKPWVEVHPANGRAELILRNSYRDIDATARSFYRLDHRGAEPPSEMSLDDIVQSVSTPWRDIVIAALDRTRSGITESEAHWLGGQRRPSPATVESLLGAHRSVRAR